MQRPYRQAVGPLKLCPRAILVKNLPKSKARTCKSSKENCCFCMIEVLRRAFPITPTPIAVKESACEDYEVCFSQTCVFEVYWRISIFKNIFCINIYIYILYTYIIYIYIYIYIYITQILNLGNQASSRLSHGRTTPWSPWTPSQKKKKNIYIYTYIYIYNCASLTCHF